MENQIYKKIEVNRKCFTSRYEPDTSHTLKYIEELEKEEIEITIDDERRFNKEMIGYFGNSIYSMLENKCPTEKDKIYCLGEKIIKLGTKNLNLYKNLKNFSDAIAEKKKLEKFPDEVYEYLYDHFVYDISDFIKEKKDNIAIEFGTEITKFMEQNEKSNNEKIQDMKEIRDNLTFLIYNKLAELFNMKKIEFIDFETYNKLAELFNMKKNKFIDFKTCVNEVMMGYSKDILNFILSSNKSCEQKFIFPCPFEYYSVPKSFIINEELKLKIFQIIDLEEDFQKKIINEEEREEEMQPLKEAAYIIIYNRIANLTDCDLHSFESKDENIVDSSFVILENMFNQSIDRFSIPLRKKQLCISEYDIVDNEIKPEILKYNKLDKSRKSIIGKLSYKVLEILEDFIIESINIKKEENEKNYLDSSKSKPSSKELKSILKQSNNVEEEPPILTEESQYLINLENNIANSSTNTKEKKKVQFSNIISIKEDTKQDNIQNINQIIL